MDRSEKQTTDFAGLEKDEAPFEHEQDSQRTHVNEDDRLRVDVAEEELTATKREVDRGSVTIEKDVVTEEQQIDVPVSEERVNVQRRTVDRDVPPGDEAFKEGTIEVPVFGEEVEVEKVSRVTEELEIEKEAVQATERVTDTVRREEVVVDGDVVEDDASIGGGGFLDRAADAITGNNDKKNSRR